jgi:L-rhamnonate dehydratase
VVSRSQNYHNQHLIMSHVNSPLSEYLPPDHRDGDTFLSELFVGDAVTRDGYITLSDRSRTGVELNEPMVSEYLLP